MSHRDDLASLPLFGSLDDGQLATVSGWFHVQNAGEGVRLVGEGAPGYTFFVLVEGAAVVTIEGQTMAVLGPGDFFGEIAILGAGRRTATVTSSTPVRLFVMFGTEFRRLEAEYPEIASKIVEATRTRAAQVAQPA